MAIKMPHKMETQRCIETFAALRLEKDHTQEDLAPLFFFYLAAFPKISCD